MLGFSNAGDRTSVVLSSLRDKALASAADRTTTLGILDWSAPDRCALEDWQAWVEGNPALGHRMGEQALASALEVDPQDVFRTEVLCQWVTAVNAAIPSGVWYALADADAPRGEAPMLTLDVAPHHSTATIEVAWKRSDGSSQVMLAAHAAGVECVVARALAPQQTWGGASCSRRQVPPASSARRCGEPT